MPRSWLATSISHLSLPLLLYLINQLFKFTSPAVVRLLYTSLYSHHQSASDYNEATFLNYLSIQFNLSCHNTTHVALLPLLSKFFGSRK